MIVLDTTVLVYAKGVDHPLREPARAVVEAVRDQRVVATTTVEVIQELAHIRGRRMPRTDASALARDYAELLRPLLHVGEEELRTGLALFEEHPALGAFASVLAAACLAVPEATLVSADAAFADVPGLGFVDLASAALLDLLGPR